MSISDKFGYQFPGLGTKNVGFPQVLGGFGFLNTWVRVGFEKNRVFPLSFGYPNPSLMSVHFKISVYFVYKKKQKWGSSQVRVPFLGYGLGTKKSGFRVPEPITISFSLIHDKVSSGVKKVAYSITC